MRKPKFAATVCGYVGATGLGLQRKKISVYSKRSLCRRSMTVREEAAILAVAIFDRFDRFTAQFFFDIFYLSFLIFPGSGLIATQSGYQGSAYQDTRRKETRRRGVKRPRKE
jgi:hypothetical protein